MAVIASLIYVGLQVRQNTQATRAQTISTRLSGQMTSDLTMIGDDGATAIAKALDQPADLTTAEILKIYGYLAPVLTAIQISFETYRLGLASREEWETARDVATEYLGFPFGLVWWNECKSNFPETFIVKVDGALKKADPDCLKAQIERMRTAAQRLPEGA